MWLWSILLKKKHILFSGNCIDKKTIKLISFRDPLLDPLLPMLISKIKCEKSSWTILKKCMANVFVVSFVVGTTLPQLDLVVRVSKGKFVHWNLVLFSSFVLWAERFLEDVVDETRFPWFWLAYHCDFQTNFFWHVIGQL